MPVLSLSTTPRKGNLKKLLTSRWLQFAAGLAISGALIAWLVLTIDWHEVWQQLRRVNLWILLPSLAITIAHLLLRSVRWRYLLCDGQKTTLTQRLDSLLVGNLATFLLPLRAGEFIRPLMLSRFKQHSFSKAFVSIVVERFFDLSAVLIMFAAMIGFIPNVPAWARQGAAALGTMAAALLVFLIVGAMAPQTISRMTEIIARAFPRRLSALLRHVVSELLEGAGVLRQPRNLAMVLVLTALVWASAVLQFHVFTYFFDLQPPPWLGFAVVVIIALAVAAPSAPGFIGVYQTACVAAFALFGLSKELAVAYSLATHLFQYVLFVVWGTVLLFKYQLSLGELSRQSEQAEDGYNPPA